MRASSMNVLRSSLSSRTIGFSNDASRKDSRSSPADAMDTSGVGNRAAKPRAPASPRRHHYGSAMRPREHGVRIGPLEPGARNSITDVAGVRVGHVTVWRDEPAVARTGVTAIVPPALPVAAGTAVLNGAGELTGSLQVREWGVLETPVYLTSTHAVGRIYDGAVAVAVAADGGDDV